MRTQFPIAHAHRENDCKSLIAFFLGSYIASAGVDIIVTLTARELYHNPRLDAGPLDCRRVNELS